MLKAPARTNPLSDPVLAAGRARVALANMVAAGYLSQADVARAAEDALTAPTVVAAPLGQYFADWVLDQVSDYVGYSERDLVVFTTLDPRLQRLAEQALAERLDEEGEKLGIGQAALAALDPGGAVVAMVGGRDYGQSQFNRATQARRQPGSAFKPFVYLAGFEHGLTPASRLFDGPIAVGNWRPANFDDRYYGDVSLREGFARSLNSVAVQISERVGYARVVEVARRLGIGTEMTVAPSLALGTSEVTLLDLTAAYATFANRGDGVWPHGIIEVRDAAGGILYRRQGSGPGQVVKPRVLAAMLDVMSSAVEWGTGKAARLDRPVAGKTGTSQDYRDAWFVGFTAELVCGVWLGNDDGKPMAKVTGGGAPARLWHAFMVKALAGLPPRLFAVPVGDAVAEAAPQPAGKTPSAFGGGFLDFLEQTLGLGARPNSDQGKLPRKRERDSR
jgi:penicillin-binding protein 1A